MIGAPVAMPLLRAASRPRGGHVAADALSERLRAALVSCTPRNKSLADALAQCVAAGRAHETAL